MNKQGYVRLKDLKQGDHIYEYLKGNAQSLWLRWKMRNRYTDH